MGDQEEGRISISIIGSISAAGPVEVSVSGDVAGRDIIKDNQFFIQADAMTQRAAEIRINDAFFACLDALLAAHARAAFLFDSYEDVTAEADRWLRDYMLTRLGNKQLLNALLIIAGRSVPELGPDLKDLTARTGLDAFGEEDVREYVEARRKIAGLDLQTIFKTGGGSPGLLAKMADVATVSSQADSEWL